MENYLDIYLSTLQKCIRRGYIQQAQNVATFLYHKHKDTLLIKLADIAFKDISIGDTQLCYDYMRFYVARNQLEPHKGMEEVHGFIYRMCLAPHDRNASELLTIVASHPVAYKEKFLLTDTPIKKLISILKSNKQRTIKRAIASTYLLKEDIDILINTYRLMGVPSEFNQSCYIYYKINRNPVVATQGLVWCLSQQQPYTSDDDLFITFPDIQGIPSCALDHTTEVGNTALNAFIKTNRKITNFIYQFIQGKGTYYVIRNTIMCLEGTQVTNRCSYPQSTLLTLLSYEAHASCYGKIPPQAIDELHTLVYHRLERLHELRKQHIKTIAPHRGCFLPTSGT